MQYCFEFISHRPHRGGLILFLIIALSTPKILSAQGNPFDKYKVKDVTKEDFSLENEVIDEYAKAVYLFDLAKVKSK